MLVEIKDMYKEYKNKMEKYYLLMKFVFKKCFVCV